MLSWDGARTEPGMSRRCLRTRSRRSIVHSCRSRERPSEILVGVGFVDGRCVVCGWASARPTRLPFCPPWLLSADLGAGDKSALRTRRSGSRSQLQLGFVPLLFAMPLALVPIAVVVVPGDRGSARRSVSGRSRPQPLPSHGGKLLVALRSCGRVCSLWGSTRSPASAGAGLLLGALGRPVSRRLLVSDGRALSATDRGAVLARHSSERRGSTPLMPLSDRDRPRGGGGHSQPLPRPHSRRCRCWRLLAVFAHERHRAPGRACSSLNKRLPGHCARPRRCLGGRRRLHGRALQRASWPWR